MKTPDEIKRGLECCKDTRCEGCPYFDIHHCAAENGLDALALIRQLEAQVPRWIPVEERLPKKWMQVLAYTSDGYRETMVYDGHWWWQRDVVVNVTHWMPLPEMPKEEEHGWD